MPFGLGKSPQRLQPGHVPDDWVGWLEPGVEVEGKIKVRGGLIRINAHVNGEITSEGTVVVHDDGEVHGDVHTRKISITGKIEGAVHASESLEIKEHGVVCGDIYTPCLVVAPGGFFDGQCHMPTPEPTVQVTPGLDTKDQHQ